MRLEIPVGDRSVVLETGKLAKQAGGSVTVQLGDTVLLSTATRSSNPRPGATFLPLSVDIEERMTAAGKIPGGFLKREGRPSDRAILTSRLTDRPIRPLFPKNYHYEIQVIGTVLVADQDTPYDTVSMVGASAALALSDPPSAAPTRHRPPPPPPPPARPPRPPPSAWAAPPRRSPSRTCRSTARSAPCASAA